MSSIEENLTTANRESDAVATVRVLFSAAGLPASEAEIAGIALGYAGLRAGINALYALPSVRYADPALRFRPDAGPSQPWADY
ncbi:hypothetical protein [Burkholderia multivorans]|uniref:hypothetical protein n=1 Tax=Burkholderia multivorans TaxID=87883 RepID=UPI0021C24D5F|nr:hypothetical protein [Burkholderia multivorans]